MLEKFASTRNDGFVSTVITCKSFGRESYATATLNNFANATEINTVVRVVFLGDNFVKSKNKRELFAVELAVTRYHIGRTGIARATYVNVV